MTWIRSGNCLSLLLLLEGIEEAILKRAQDKLTTESVCSPFNDDSFGGTHVSIALYCLTQSPNLSVSGAHVVHAVSKILLRGNDTVASLKDA